jgi:hypothetical protein
MKVIGVAVLDPIFATEAVFGDFAASLDLAKGRQPSQGGMGRYVFEEMLPGCGELHPAYELLAIAVVDIDNLEWNEVKDDLASRLSSVLDAVNKTQKFALNFRASVLTGRMDDGRYLVVVPCDDSCMALEDGGHSYKSLNEDYAPHLQHLRQMLETYEPQSTTSLDNVEASLAACSVDSDKYV